MSDFRRANNFDLLRLLAAFQVAVFHAGSHLTVPIPDVVSAVAGLFPGVPIFFTISGFLVFQSYERSNGNLRQYAFNRAVRIFPGLVAACLLSLVLILLYAPHTNFADLALWSLGQVTIFQYFTPASLRSYGVGTPNGSLWTIPVELEFYIFLPIAYYVLRTRGVTSLLAFFVLSIASYYVAFALLPPEGIAYKLLFVSVLPYLYNFLFGVVIAIYFNKYRSLLIGKGPYWLVAYLAINLLNIVRLHWWVVTYNPNLLGVLSNTLLSLTIISLAFSCQGLSMRWLQGHDVSYGIYIYHMPIVNVMVQRGDTGQYVYLFAALALTTVLAVLSWRVVENPFLTLKRRRHAYPGGSPALSADANAT